MSKQIIEVKWINQSPATIGIALLKDRDTGELSYKIGAFERPTSGSVTDQMYIANKGTDFNPRDYFLDLETVNERKSSNDWFMELPEGFKVTMIDPDGWDRTNFKESMEELITKKEFKKRMSESTVVGLGMSLINDW